MLVSRPEVRRVHDSVDVAAEGPVMGPAGVERRDVDSLRPDAPLVERHPYRCPASHSHLYGLAVEDGSGGGRAGGLPHAIDPQLNSRRRLPHGDMRPLVERERGGQRNRSEFDGDLPRRPVSAYRQCASRQHHVSGRRGGGLNIDNEPVVFHRAIAVGDPVPHITGLNRGRRAAQDAGGGIERQPGRPE